MDENIFDKRRLKTFSNCKELVRSMVGTRDGVIVYNEKFRVDLENTCYKASMCEDLQQENQELKDRIDKAINEIQYIIDYGFDYDGFNKVDSLKILIDMLVDYAIKSKTILKGDKE